jgi:hypothetical protein
VTPGNRQQANALLAPLRRTFLPNRVLAAVTQGAQLDAHAALVPLLEEKRALRGQPTAYDCERRVCELPTGDPEVFAKQIGKVEPLPARAQSQTRRRHPRAGAIEPPYPAHAKEKDVPRKPDSIRRRSH